MSGQKNHITALSEKLTTESGGHRYGSSNFENNVNKTIYHAIVRDITDLAKKNRIKAEIVTIDNNGKMQAGRDKNLSIDQLPICIPLVPEFVHVRPKVGECVLLLVENPSDITSVRYWIGPLRTSQINLDYESFETSNSMYNRSDYNNKEIFKTTNDNNQKISDELPQQSEIALQGRNDADIILKNRELVIVTGKFQKQTVEINKLHPCYVQLKQFDDNPVSTSGALSSAQNNTFIPFSQTNIVGTNINLISVEGKNRNIKSKTIESNTNQKNLDRFGDTAKQLHPLVFGDNLVDLLKVIVSFSLSHIHTPEAPAVAPVKDIEILSSYKNDNKMQEILSQNVRTN
jgi:hypothetical protein